MNKILYQHADPDNTGTVSKEYFLATAEAIFSLPKENVNELLEVFKVFDINNTGKISITNFKKVQVDIGQGFSEEEADDIINNIDVDRDGKNSFSFFSIFD